MVDIRKFQRELLRIMEGFSFWNAGETGRGPTGRWALSREYKHEVWAYYSLNRKAIGKESAQQASFLPPIAFLPDFHLPNTTPLEEKIRIELWSYFINSGWVYIDSRESLAVSVEFPLRWQGSHLSFSPMLWAVGARDHVHCRAVTDTWLGSTL